MKHSVKRAISLLLAVLTISLCFGILAIAVDYAPDAYDIVCPEAEDGEHDFQLAIDKSCLKRKNEKAYIVEYCTLCNQTKKTEYKTPKAHTPVAVPEVPATCYETGLTEGSVCSVCGTVIVKQNDVPKVSHTDKNDDGWCDVKECNAELRYHCPICNKEHEGFFGGIAKFFHNMLYQLQGLFRF